MVFLWKISVKKIYFHEDSKTTLRRVQVQVLMSQQISSKAFKVLGLVMRPSKDIKSGKSLKSSYTASGRPVLEYGSTIWDPYTVSDSDQLESVQQRFWRFACFVLGILRLALPIIPTITNCLYC